MSAITLFSNLNIRSDASSSAEKRIPQYSDIHVGGCFRVGAKLRLEPEAGPLFSAVSFRRAFDAAEIVTRKVGVFRNVVPSIVSLPSTMSPTL
jgi:hypothetical protein